MFIREKTSRGRKAFYAVKNRRLKNGRIKQSVLAYLGTAKSLSEAIEYWTGALQNQVAQRCEIASDLLVLSLKHKIFDDREFSDAERRISTRYYKLQKRIEIASKRISQTKRRIALLKRLLKSESSRQVPMKEIQLER